MKQKRIVSALTASAISVAAFSALPVTAGAAEVSAASYYTSNAASSDLGNGTYKNPVLYTDVADPDVICAPGPDGKEAYYMVSTAMSNSPGCPIMKSTDLVNWETVSYLYDSLDYDNDALSLRNGKQAYGWGQWATSIKYNEKNKTFYILLFSYTTGTSQVYTSKDVENGPWKKSEFRTYHDCSIFIDDDGEVYIFYGQNSFYCKHLVEDEEGYLHPEEEADDPNNDGVQIVEHSGAYLVPDFIDSQYAGIEKGTLWDQMNGQDFIIGGEGCHAYKVDGRYYLIFITWPGGDIWRRSEACFRSVPDENGNHSIYGPYEGMMIMSDNVKYDGYTGGEGVAQGGMTNAIGGSVRSSEGNWYGIIYQDHGAAGRCPMLVNVDWNKPGYEGWPIMSTTATGTIPTESGTVSERKSLVESDEFNNGTRRTTSEIIEKPKTKTFSVQTAAADENGSEVFNFLLKNNYWQDIVIASKNVKAGEWTEISGSFTAPEDFDGGYIFFNSESSNTDFYLDACSVKKADGGELLENGDMENSGDDNIPYYWGKEGNAAVIKTTEESADGSASMLVKDRASSADGVMQYVTLVPGETYTVSAKVMYKSKAAQDKPTETEKGYELSGEYIINGDMEKTDGTKPSDWGAKGTAEIASAEEENGRVMKVSGRASAEDGAMQFTNADIKANKTYKVSMKIKSDEADTFKFVFQNNFWQNISAAEGKTTAGKWTEISGYFNTPKDFDGGSIMLISESTSCDFCVDDVKMQLATEIGTDIVTNGDFETGTLEPWSTRYGNSKIEISTDSHSGSYSAYVSERKDTGAGAALVLDGKIEVLRDYEANAWIKYTDGPNEKVFNMTLEHKNASGETGYQVIGSVTAKKGEWCQISGNITLGKDIGTESNKLYIETAWTATPDGVNDLMSYYVDDISLIKQPEVEWETAAEGENDYNGSNLKTVWQWNHTPDNRYWSLTERPGWLRLRTAKVVENIQQARNTLTQRTFGPTCSGWTKLDVSKMRNGDYAGLAALQEGYGLLAVKKYGGRKTIVIVEPESEPNDAAKMMNIPTKETYIADLDRDEVYFKTEYEFHGEQWNDYVRFYYSLDGVNWTFAYEKNNLVYHLSHFTGYKFALFNYATNSLGDKQYGNDGYVDFDYFRVDGKITGDGTATENINAELGSPEVIRSVPNKKYTVPMTMDSVPTECGKIEAAFTIPENSRLSEVVFGNGVSDKARYEVKDGKVIITVEGDSNLYTADESRKFAELVFVTTGFVQEDKDSVDGGKGIIRKLSPDYIRLYGNSEGKEFDVNTQQATATIAMKKVDYGTVIKNPGMSNPLITHKFGADPFALEYNGRLYLYLTGDNYYTDEDGQIAGSPTTGAVNNEYANAQCITVISTTDMVNWTDHGEIKAAGEDGAAKFAGYSWAPCIAVKNIDGKDKFFLYYTDNTAGIVVLEGDSPVGPFTSPLDKHLIGWEKGDDGKYLVPGVEDCTWIFDPAVLVDDDGSAYLYFGGGTDAAKGGTDENPGSARVVKLGDDMISLDGEMKKIDAPCILEDSGIHKYDGKYYYSYSTNWSCKSLPNVAIAYLVSDSPMGPFKAPEGEDLAGVVLPPMGEYFDIYSNNHHAIFEYKGEWYIAYHCGLVDAGYHTTARYLGYRSAQVEKLEHNEDGTLATVTPSRAGVSAADTLNPYKRNEAETMAWHKEKVSGSYKVVQKKSPDTGDITDWDVWIENDAEKMKTAVCTEPGAEYNFNNLALTNLKNDDWSAVANADFGNAKSLKFSIKAKGIAGGRVEVYADSLDGEKIAEIAIAPNSAYTVYEAEAALIKGTHNIFFKYVGGDGQLFELDWWSFANDSSKEWTVNVVSENDKVNAEIKNVASGNTAAVVYAAEYSKSGELIAVKQKEITVQNGETKNESFELNTSNTIKVFLWNGADMAALSDAAE